jgi:PAS domain S-box-containing protein
MLFSPRLVLLRRKMGGVVHVVHVRDEGGSRQRWCDHDRIGVTAVTPGFDPGGTDGADCVVVDDGDGVDATAVVRRVRATRSVPVVVRAPADAADARPLVFGADGDAHLADGPPRDWHDPAAFAPFLLSVAGDGADGMAKTDALHDAAMELVYCDSETEVFEYAVEAASNLLELEQSAIYTLEGSKLVPTATGGSPVIPEPEAATFDLDQGVLGHVYRTGESVVVGDARDHEVAEPTADAIRAGVCVSLGEIGVFIAIDDEPDAFDERDRTLLEILAAHVRTAVDRIRTRAGIERERDRFAALFEHVPDPLVVAEPTNEGPRIRHANPAFESTFGVAAADVEDEVVRDVIGLAPDGERIDVPADGHTVEEIRREADGGVRTFLFRGFPVEIGGEVRHVAFFTDVTEQKRRRRELEGKTERLEEFTSIVSHDLRNPLGVARGWVEQGLDRPELAERALEEVDVSLDRMESLVDDLLALAREGWSVDGKIPVEARPLVQRAWDGLETGEATLRVEWDGTVAADRDMATELFENLFRNSVEHGSTKSRSSESPDDPAEHGSPNRSGGTDGVTVTVGTLPGEEGVFVADDGPGIPPEVRESVFEMGVTTDDAGTGLGLAIVDRIAEAHGWDVSATESDTGGARFEIRFGER